MVGAAQKGGKEAVPVTYEMEMTVPCVCPPLAFISYESNSIARIAGDPSLCVFTATERDRLRDELLRRRAQGYKEKGREAHEIARNTVCHPRVTSLRQHRALVLNLSMDIHIIYTREDIIIGETRSRRAIPLDEQRGKVDET